MISSTITDATRRIAELGARTGPEVSAASQAIFKPLHEAALQDGHSVKSDQQYGPHTRHRLDVHTASSEGAMRPVVLFIHGGGFVRGDKTMPDSFHYGNVARWAVEKGFVAVNMTYRLAPEFKWPSGGDDVDLAMQWIKKNISQFGGDPQSIFLLGHSAGAAHAATWLTRNLGKHPDSPLPAGCILLSGNYDQTIGQPRVEYYGEDKSAYKVQSTMGDVVTCGIPIFLGIGEFDPPEILCHSISLYSLFCEKAMPQPRFVQAQGHNHYTITHHLGTDDNRLGNELVSFIQSNKHNTSN